MEKDDILISLRSWGKGLVDAPPPEIGALLRWIRQRDRGGEGLRDLDSVLREAGFALMAGIYEGVTNSVLRGGYEGFARSRAGERQRFLDYRSKTYRTVLGPVPVRRAAYAGKGKLHFPLDERLGVNGRGWTEGLEALVVEAGVDHDFEAASHWLGRAGVEISDTTVWRACQEAGEAVRKREEDDVGRVPPAVPRSPGDLAVEADGFCVPTDEGWKQIRAGVVGKVLAGGERDRLVEKTYVATFQEADRFWALLRMSAEARGWERARSRIFLSDGSREIQDESEEVFADAERILDFYHAAEHLWKIAEAVFGPGEARGRRWVREQREHLRRSQGEAVVRAIRALARRWPQARRLCRREARYFQRNLERTRYLRYRRRGWPIGSGAIEGGGKHLVTTRFKGNGKRWKAEKLPNFLALRVHVLNHRDQPRLALRNAA
jgi:hypothetical protein